MISATVVKKFKEIVGLENVFEDEADLHAYSYDSAVLDAVIPG